MYVLDVNLLIALVDPAHVQHDQAHERLAPVGCKAFATRPLTENILVRMAGHPKCPTRPVCPAHGYTGARGHGGMKLLPGD